MNSSLPSIGADGCDYSLLTELTHWSQSGQDSGDDSFGIYTIRNSAVVFQSMLYSLFAAPTVALSASLMFTAVLLCMVYHVVSWYKFLAAWNIISRARQLDLSISRRRWRLSYRQLQQTQIHFTCMSDQHMTCPICLTDFYEQELVTACEEGCGHWFHRECLFRWLDHSEACPCCRKDLLTPHTRGWMEELLAGLVGGRRRY